jgi:hypothetical protein
LQVIDFSQLRVWSSLAITVGANNNWGNEVSGGARNHPAAPSTRFSPSPSRLADDADHDLRQCRTGPDFSRGRAGLSKTLHYTRRAVRAFPNHLAAWRTADDAARVVEDAVLAASLRALDGHGQPPSMKDRRRAKQLRSAANLLLDKALGEMKAEHPSSSNVNSGAFSGRPH